MFSRVIVTGGLGHIGSKLVETLSIRFPATQIVVVDSLLTQRYCSLFSFASRPNITFYNESILEFGFAETLKSSDMVIHLAAITDAEASVRNASQVIENNILSTTRVSEAVANAGANMITVSSTSVYGSQESEVDERCDLRQLSPQSPYAAAKIKEEIHIKQMCAKSGLKAVILRFGTIYGFSPGMRFHTAVNKFCFQAALGLPITVWRTAYDQKRPYLALTDAIESIIHFLKYPECEGEIYNVITSNHSVREVVDAIRGYEPNLKIKYVDSEIMNQLSYNVRDEKLRSRGFSPSGVLTAGIAETISRLSNLKPRGEL